MLIRNRAKNAQAPERVNDFATPGFINLLCRDVVLGGWLSPSVAG